ncbi:MAG TPA: UDP-N-acetylglucosamine 1-carboxyvinyltransferase [Solirubrobacterales bacterium]
MSGPPLRPLPAEPRSLLVEGGRPLAGSVAIQGSKKSLPKILMATALTDDPCLVENVSWVDDLEVAAGVLRGMGRKADRIGPRRIEVKGACGSGGSIRSTLTGVSDRSRVPVLAAGPQLVRFGEAWVPPLGGDLIGPRPVDAHISMLRSLGAQVERRDGWLRATALALQGAPLKLKFPMVGVTEHALLTGVLVPGRTEIHNAAVDPEIEELAAVLKAMGAKIEIEARARRISIDGVAVLEGFRHTVGQDRMEAGSWASLALATGGEITVEGLGVYGMEPFLRVYRAAGGRAVEGSEGICFSRSGKSEATLRIESGPWPLYESDWHPPMVTALTQTAAISAVHETLFADRFTTVASLREMGAEIELHSSCGIGSSPCRLARQGDAHRAVIKGPSRLRAGRLQLRDLRGGFGLLAAALVATGESVLSGGEVLERGYESLPERIRRLGGAVHGLD